MQAHGRAADRSSLTFAHGEARLVFDARSQTQSESLVLTPVQVGLDPSGNKLNYVVLPGNESVLMADAMSKRSWWKAVDKGSPNNFWWGGNGQRFGWQEFQRGRYQIDEARQVVGCMCALSNLRCMIQGSKDRL